MQGGAERRVGPGNRDRHHVAAGGLQRLRDPLAAGHQSRVVLLMDHAQNVAESVGHQSLPGLDAGGCRVLPDEVERPQRLPVVDPVVEGDDRRALVDRVLDRAALRVDVWNRERDPLGVAGDRLLDQRRLRGAPGISRRAVVKRHVEVLGGLQRAPLKRHPEGVGCRPVVHHRDGDRSRRVGGRSGAGRCGAAPAPGQKQRRDREQSEPRRDRRSRPPAALGPAR